MIKPLYARCHAGNNLNSCAVPELSMLYGGVDDCLMAVMNCIAVYRYPFIVFSDSSNQAIEMTNGQKLAAFVTKMGFGTIIATPIALGTHRTPIQIWIWAFADKHTAFLKYMDLRMPELEKACKA